MKQALVVNNRHKHYHKASAQYTQLVQLKNNVVPITRKRGRPKKLSTVIKLHNYIYPNHHPQLKR